jgi:uncharacterized membrane protein YphA (DoxX/SURF4 family)
MVGIAHRAGLAAFLAGLDKFFNLLTDWRAYLSPLATRIFPVSNGALLHIVGIIEMAAGLALLAGITRLGGYVVMAWLIAIAVNLLTTGKFYDVAVRDVEMAIAAYTLARLSEVRYSALAANPRASTMSIFGVTTG